MSLFFKLSAESLPEPMELLELLELLGLLGAVELQPAELERSSAQGLAILLSSREGDLNVLQNFQSFFPR